ncbi:MAG: hypothetical protein LBB86_09450 [Oscillospiraceae bacterium]|jgi:hypothetical protein|nr:hypothetical protein [Oscillospiraceae bacterium]
MENKIKEMFVSLRSMETERKVLRSLERATAEQETRLASLGRRLQLAELLLSLANEDEVLVITRHLVDGIDWPRIVVDYKNRWGEDFLKTERTMINYQKRGLRKMVRFISEYPELRDRLDT